MSGRQYTIAAGDYEATIAEVGAGLRALRHRGADVTCAYGEDTLPPKGCGMTMVPWPNRIRGGRYTFDGVDQQLGISEPKFGNASHGLARWVRWGLVEAAAERVTLCFDIAPQSGYPHAVRAEITYALDADSGLTTTLSATNHGSSRAPFGVGNHPYLSARGQRLDDVELTVPAATTLDVDEANIPVGRHPVGGTPDDLRAGGPLGGRRFDSCYTDLSGSEVTLRTAAGGARLRFDEAYRFLQVFTVDELTAAGGGVAVEPMTCAPDAFNSGDGLLVLEPGQSWMSGLWGIEAL